MPHAYTEDQLVEQPAIGLVVALVYLTATQMQNLRRTRDLLLSGQVNLEGYNG